MLPNVIGTGEKDLETGHPPWDPILFGSFLGSSCFCRGYGILPC